MSIARHSRICARACRNFAWRRSVRPLHGPTSGLRPLHPAAAAAPEESAPSNPSDMRLQQLQVMRQQH
ncbi:hypothetical protein E2562_012027 [Oryza meyeriana var. granulata]|uniref:Uncharacterized protein n=1 Tax=Oryza meyeriana var. granulata TaxID=110450 RepID=A0A6G1D375_9ORYZ|nr:hypothetical protein E2562_012027 [Oryza meyeriana var. granulata]